MTGLYPGITERLERLRTYCTRWVRRDHPCSNAPFLPKNDRRAGVLEAALRHPLPRTSSIEDWSKGHPTHPAACCDLSAGGKFLGMRLSCREHGPNPFPLDKDGAEELHRTGNKDRDMLSNQQQGGGHIC